MMSFLMREQSTLTSQEWQALDQIVVQVARRNLVARHFLSIQGPVGAGVASFPVDRFRGGEMGSISLFGAEEENMVVIQSRRFAPLPILYRDFRLDWRELEASRRQGMPFDTTPAAIAASAVAQAEDQVIFNGNDELQQEGFLNVEGRQQVPLGDWGTTNGGFNAVVSAVRTLVDHGFRGPFTLAVPPLLFAQLNRVFDNTGVLEVDQVQRLVGGGVYMTTALPQDIAVLVAPGPENMDLLIAQDLVTAFLEATAMEQHFRVLEVLSLRIKRPGAVCTLGQV